MNDRIKQLISENRPVTPAELRKAAGVTQSDVAEKLGTYQSEVSAMERRSMRFATLERYVAALGGESVVMAYFGDEGVEIAMPEPEASE